MRKYEYGFYMSYNIPRVKQTSTTKEILKVLLITGMFCIAATNPYFIKNIIKTYFKNSSREKTKNYSQSFARLHKKNFIKIKKDKKGNTVVTLTKEGREYIHKQNIDAIQIKKPKQWDHQWRIMMYDIPVHHKKASDAFRFKVKQLGLYPIQKSVWIHPYDFYQEMERVCEIFNLDAKKYILYFTSPHLPNEIKIENHFKL